MTEIFVSTLFWFLTDMCKDLVFSFEHKVLTDHASVIHTDTTDNNETDHDSVLLSLGTTID